LNLDTGALEAEPVEIEHRNPITKEKIKETTWVCTKANQFFGEKRNENKRWKEISTEEEIEGELEEGGLTF